MNGGGSSRKLLGAFGGGGAGDGVGGGMDGAVTPRRLGPPASQTFRPRGGPTTPRNGPGVHSNRGGRSSSPSPSWDQQLRQNSFARGAGTPRNQNGLNGRTTPRFQQQRRGGGGDEGDDWEVGINGWAGESGGRSNDGGGSGGDVWSSHGMAPLIPNGGANGDGGGGGGGIRNQPVNGGGARVRSISSEPGEPPLDVYHQNQSSEQNGGGGGGYSSPGSPTGPLTVGLRQTNSYESIPTLHHKIQSGGSGKSVPKKSALKKSILKPSGSYANLTSLDGEGGGDPIHVHPPLSPTGSAAFDQLLHSTLFQTPLTTHQCLTVYTPRVYAAPRCIIPPLDVERTRI